MVRRSLGVVQIPYVVNAPSAFGQGPFPEHGQDILHEAFNHSFEHVGDPRASDRMGRSEAVLYESRQQLDATT